MDVPSAVRIGILGPVEAGHGGARVALRPGRERALAALLVLNAGRLLTADRVVALLWESPPDSARAQVYNLVSALRRRLGGAYGAEVLVTADGGYRLAAGAHRSDLDEFRTAVARGRAALEAGDVDDAADLLTAALDCWRGEALGGCTAPFAAGARQALEEERLRTLEALLDVRLTLGRYEEVLAEVGPWLERQPHREDLYRRQMQALAALDRRADALACYRRAYRRLQDDLGVSPGASLRRLHEQILLDTVPTPALAPEPTPARVRAYRGVRTSAGAGNGAGVGMGAGAGNGAGASAGDGAGAGPGARNGAGTGAGNGAEVGVRAGAGTNSDARGSDVSAPGGTTRDAGPARPTAEATTATAEPAALEAPGTPGAPGHARPTAEPGAPALPTAPEVPGAPAIPTAPAPSAPPNPPTPPTPAPTPLTTTPTTPAIPTQPLPKDARPPSRLTTPPHPTPRQLPSAPENLYGREDLFTDIRTALRTRGLAAPVVLLTGPGGVGKTAAALHAGHRLAGLFPGGQLYADLRGSHEEPADPARTAARFLRSLGVAGQDVPADPDELAAELRSRLAGRRVLLVLDDVRDENQLRPLLPGTGDCAVLATSRSRLAALADARVFPVSTLGPADAAALLAGLVGERRARAEARATADVAALCGHLPLALRIAGARLAARPDWTVRAFHDRLAQHHQRLDQLAVGDLDVRASINLSYRALTGPQRLVLRRLGLLDAHSVPGWVVAALAGLDPPAAARVQDTLVECHLLQPCGVDRLGQSRYQLHALVRDFARERAYAEDSDAEREAALGRMLRGWLSLASQAAGRLGHGGVLDPVPPDDQAPAALVRAVREQPERWFAAEQAGLTGAVHLACRLRLPELACDLALQLDAYLVIRFHEAERESLIRAAIDCWGEGPARDRRLSRLYFLLCWAMYQQDRYAELAQAAEQGLRVATELGDPEVVADASWQLGRATALTGRLTEAAAYYRETVEAAQRLGLSERAQVYALTGLANVLADLGESTAALERYAQALARHHAPDRTRVVMLLRCAEAAADAEQGPRVRELLAEGARLVAEIGDEVGAAHVARVHALADLVDGDWPRARARLAGVLDTLRAHRERSGTAQALRSLGDAAIGAGRWDEARGHLAQALDLHLRMSLPVEAARTEARLAVVLRLTDEPALADGHARSLRELLDRFALPPSCLRLPGHVHRLLASADVAGVGRPGWPTG